MNKSEFTKQIVEPRLRKIKDVLAAKGDEYAVGKTFDHNFMSAGRMSDQSPELALWGMMVKHLVSVKDMIDGRTEVTQAKVDEKIGDTINYFILLEGLFIKYYPEEEDNDLPF